MWSFTTGTCRAGSTPRRELTKSSLPPTSPGLGNSEIMEFLKGLVSDQTGIPVKNICPTESLTSYGIDSIGVVRVFLVSWSEPLISSLPHVSPNLQASQRTS